MGYYHGDLDDFDWNDNEEITKNETVKVSERKDPKKDSMPCNHCGQFVFMAEANEPDGTFKCRACRFDPYR